MKRFVKIGNWLIFLHSLRWTLNAHAVAMAMGSSLSIDRAYCLLPSRGPFKDVARYFFCIIDVIVTGASSLSIELF